MSQLLSILAGRYRELAGRVDELERLEAGSGGSGEMTIHVLATTTGLGPYHTVSGLTAGQYLRATSSTEAAFAAIEDGDLPSTIVRDSVQVIAGAGLTGGGALSSDVTLDVAAADTSILVSADSIQVQLATPSGLAVSAGLMVDDAIAGAGLTITAKVLAVGSGDGLTVTADAVSLTTPGTLSDSSVNNAAGSHTHELDGTIARTADLHDAVTLGTSLAANLLGLTGQELTLDTQAANLVLAGPTTGAAAAPAFRALVDADIPAEIARDGDLHDAVTLGAGSDSILTLSGQELTLGDVATQAELDAHEANTTAHHPLVTFGADTAPLFSIGTGQIINFDNQTANTVLAGPASGAAADPTMRALVEADLPATVVLSSRSVIAGAGLTGGGALTADVTLNVGAGDGIDVAADSIAVDVTDILGNGLVESANNIGLGTPSQLTVSTTNAVTTSSHTHAITSSSAITTATAVLMATDSNGRHRLMGLGIGAAATGNGYLTLGGTATINSSGAALTIAPAAGEHLLVNLSATGDFKVNTDDLVVDTSTGNVSMAGSLDITGAILLGATLGFAGAGVITTVSGTLTISGDATVTSTLTADSAVVTTSARVGSGLYVGSTGTAPDADDIHYDGNLKSVKSAVTHDVYGFHPLTVPLTSASWNATAKTAADNGTIELSTVFGLSLYVKAVLVELRISSAAAVGRYASLSATPTNPYTLTVKNFSTSITNHQTAPVPTYDGDIYFETNGGNITVRIWGYWI